MRAGRAISTIIALLALAAPLGAASFEVRASGLLTMTTNAFSDPLPKQSTSSGWNGDEWLSTIEYLRRFDGGLSLTFDIRPQEDSRTGLSLSFQWGRAFKSTTWEPSQRDDYDSAWNWVARDSLSDQDDAIFFGIGPVFTATFPEIYLSLAIRASVGSFNLFQDSVAVGLQMEPVISVPCFGSDFLLTAGLTFTAHFWDFLIHDDVHWYTPEFFMMSLGAHVGFAIRFNGGQS